MAQFCVTANAEFYCYVEAATPEEAIRLSKTSDDWGRTLGMPLTGHKVHEGQDASLAELQSDVLRLSLELRRCIAVGCGVSEVTVALEVARELLYAHPDYGSTCRSADP